MTKPSPRDIILKVCMTAEEFIPFRDRHAATRTPHSVAVRALIAEDMARHAAQIAAQSSIQIGGRHDVISKTNRSSEIEIGKWPGDGHQRQVKFPSKPARAVRTVARLNL